MKKKPAAIIDSDSDSEEDFIPKEQKKTNKASKIDSSSDEDNFTPSVKKMPSATTDSESESEEIWEESQGDILNEHKITEKDTEKDSSSEEEDDTGLFLDAESGILENQEKSPDNSENKDDSIFILESSPPPPPTQKTLGIRKDLFEPEKEVSVERKESPKFNSPDEIKLMSKQLEYNQQQVQKYMKLLSTTGGGVMLPDKGAKIRRELQFVKDRSSILKEKLEKAKENGKNLPISIDNMCFGKSTCFEFLKFL